MTKGMNTCVKGALCGIAVVGLIAALTNCRFNKKYRIRRAAFKAMRGFNCIVSGIKDLL